MYESVNQWTAGNAIEITNSEKNGCGIVPRKVEKIAQPPMVYSIQINTVFQIKNDRFPP
jgi:hypothetical protein